MKSWLSAVLGLNTSGGIKTGFKKKTIVTNIKPLTSWSTPVSAMSRRAGNKGAKNDDVHKKNIGV